MIKEAKKDALLPGVALDYMSKELRDEHFCLNKMLLDMKTKEKTYDYFYLYPILSSTNRVGIGFTLVRKHEKTPLYFRDAHLKAQSYLSGNRVNDLSAKDLYNHLAPVVKQHFERAQRLVQHDKPQDSDKRLRSSGSGSSLDGETGHPPKRLSAEEAAP